MEQSDTAVAFRDNPTGGKTKVRTVGADDELRVLAKKPGPCDSNSWSVRLRNRSDVRWSAVHGSRGNGCQRMLHIMYAWLRHTRPHERLLDPPLQGMLD